MKGRHTCARCGRTRYADRLREIAGRFVREASVRKLPAYRWEDEDVWRGTCSEHGEDVDVVWPEG